MWLATAACFFVVPYCCTLLLHSIVSLTLYRLVILVVVRASRVLQPVWVQLLWTPVEPLYSLIVNLQSESTLFLVTLTTLVAAVGSTKNRNVLTFVELYTQTDVWRHTEQHAA